MYPINTIAEDLHEVLQGVWLTSDPKYLKGMNFHRIVDLMAKVWHFSRHENTVRAEILDKRARNCPPHRVVKFERPKLNSMDLQTVEMRSIPIGHGLPLGREYFANPAYKDWHNPGDVITRFVKPDLPEL